MYESQCIAGMPATFAPHKNELHPTPGPSLRLTIISEPAAAHTHRRGATTGRCFETTCSQRAVRRNDAGNRTPEALYGMGWASSTHRRAVASPLPDSQLQATSRIRIATARTEALHLYSLG